jgi:hypothetical protein
MKFYEDVIYEKQIPVGMKTGAKRYITDNTILIDKFTRSGKTVEIATVEDAKVLEDVLNFYHEEREKADDISFKYAHLKYLIQEAYDNETSENTKSVLKQLLEAIQ